MLTLENNFFYYIKYTTDKQLNVNKKPLKIQFNMAQEPTEDKLLTVAAAQKTGKKMIIKGQ